MKKSQLLLFGSILLCSLMISIHSAGAGGFTVTSPQIKDGAKMSMDQILNGFGCTGKNISPELVWQAPPEGTQSFAVTVYDPDAPTGSGWWHWVIFNILADVRKLPADAGNLTKSKAPKGSIQSRTDFGKTGYGGACPPRGHGPHRYIFTVYALDIDSLPLDTSATAAMVGFHLNRHALAKTQLTAIYEQK